MHVPFLKHVANGTSEPMAGLRYMLFRGDIISDKTYQGICFSHSPLSVAYVSWVEWPLFHHTHELCMSLSHAYQM